MQGKHSSRSGLARRTQQDTDANVPGTGCTSRASLDREKIIPSWILCPGRRVSLKSIPPQSQTRHPRRRSPQHIPRGLDFVRQHRPLIASSQHTTERRSRRCASEKRRPPQHISKKQARSSWSSGSTALDTHACSNRCTSSREKGTASLTAGNVHLP